MEVEITQRQYRIIMIGIIVWLLFSVGSFIYFKSKCKMAQERPLEYISKQYNLDQCRCTTISGAQFFNFNRERAWTEQILNSPKINFEPGGE